MFNILGWIIFFPFKLFGKVFGGLWRLIGWFLFAGDMTHWGRKK